MLCLIVLHSLVLVHSFEFNPSDYELYGSTVAANGQFIVAIQSRTGVTFSATTNYLATPPIHCTVTFTPLSGRESYATMVAVGRNSFVSANIHKFVFIVYSQNDTKTYLVIASINFAPCSSTMLSVKDVLVSPYETYSVLGVNSDSTFAFYFVDRSAFVQNLNTFTSTPKNSWMNGGGVSIVPAGIDLKYSWGILAVYKRDTSGGSTATKFRPTIYQLNFTNCFTSLNSLCFKLTLAESISYPFTWQASKAPPTDVARNEYDSLYDISVSINDQDYVLLGIQSINTVFCFSNASTSFDAHTSRIPSTVPSIGFGKSVGWLDNTTATVLMNNFTLDYAQWRSSHIELYPIIPPYPLSNAGSAYSSYPNAHQQIWRQLNSRLIDMVAVPDSGSVVYMDYNGAVHVIRPSVAGSYAYTSGDAEKTNNTIFVARTIRCPSGTLKNQSAEGKDLFRHCILCEEGTFYSANRSNVTNKCAPCDTSLYYCPWGAVTEMPVSVLETITQAYVYPQSPENDNFEDILLLNMFNIDFPPHCLAKQPLLYGIIIIGVGCLFLLFMGILKLTGKLKRQRRMMKSLFKQTDLIGEGELWIGGVASLAIIVVSVFAYRFSSEFMYQYPIETAHDATLACDPTLRNAQFSTSMQSLGTPLLEEEQPLFDMLDSQPFTLNVAFINTDFTKEQLYVSHVLGSIRVNLSYTTHQSEGILYISTNLTSHSTTIQFTVLSHSAVGALRVGLSGPAITNDNYHVKELNFSYAFNHTNRTVTQDPIITVHLIKLVNETEPLSSNGNIDYSAIWIPTFVKNDEQLFYTDSDFQLYHIYDRTVFTVKLTEATYYIFNKQEPITKLTEVIFTDILFTTMCIELFALTFLFFKLAVLPILKAILGLCFKSHKVAPKGKRAGGCPYCRSVNRESLPSHRVPIQRAPKDAPAHPIRRHMNPTEKPQPS